MKFDVLFAGLENAGWPALLVDGAGVICHANQTAIQVFGPAFQSDALQFPAIWAPENSSTPGDFFAQWRESPFPGVPVKFKIEAGATASYFTSVCALTK